MNRRWGILCWLVADLAGQSTSTITGSITDPGGALLPQVRIRVRQVDTNATRQAVANDEGSYTVTNLAPGSYELIIEKEGFRTHRETGLVLELGQVRRVDIRLQLGALAESVTVVSEPPLLNTDSGAIKGDVITNQQINEIPLDGRDFVDLALMVPGVVPMAQGGQGSGLNVNGARSDSTNYSVDGFNSRNPRGAASQVRPNMGAMQNGRTADDGGRACAHYLGAHLP